jgi:uncharacterized OB-fold protein
MTDQPLPVPTPTSAPFWDALRGGELLVQQCGTCDRWVHYPRNRCPHCGRADLRWRPVKPEGTVYAFTVTRRPTAPMFEHDVPQIIAIVELTNGVRMTTTLVVDDSEPLAVGAPVAGVFDRVTDDVTLLRFRLR